MRIHQFQSLKQEVVTSWETICFYENQVSKTDIISQFFHKVNGIQLKVLRVQYYSSIDEILQNNLVNYLLARVVSLRSNQLCLLAPRAV